MSVRSDHELLQAALDLTSSLDLKSALNTFVAQACRLTGTPYGALCVLDSWGSTSMLIEHRDFEYAPKVPNSLKAQIPASGYLRINNPAELEEFIAEIPVNTHTKNTDSAELDEPLDPQIESFLGVSVLVHEQVYGRLYLIGKPGGFKDSDAEILTALAPAAGNAVENAHLYADARRTERWISASQSLTTTMLEGTDEEEALELIARTVREVSRADTAIIVLPSVGDTWAAEIIDGYLADSLLGIVFPSEGRAMSVLREGTGMIVDSMARAQTMRVPQLSAFGPALYAPLRSRGNTAGVLILLRRIGTPEFDSSELTLAESLASQAALALELASARHAEDVAALLDERDRIGRDLHDFAIQELFATGMRLEAAKQKVTDGDLDKESIIAALDHSLAGIDGAVRQIRAIVHNLREPDQSVALVERIRRESSLTRSFLGFAPSLLITLDGVAVNEDEAAEQDMIDRIDQLIDPELGDDVVAIVREGLSNIARHAHATAGAVTVDVRGQGADGQVRVSIADDGRGIDPNRTRNSGLANMQERARRLGGSFELGSGIGGLGASLIWTVPLS